MGLYLLNFCYVLKFNSGSGVFINTASLFKATIAKEASYTELITRFGYLIRLYESKIILGIVMI